jgi:uncharacterized membrane protein
LLSKAVLKTVLLYVMALGYIAAGINHFWHPRFYLRLMPPYLPAPHGLNYLSGIIEIVLGVLLLAEATRPVAAWCLAGPAAAFYAGAYLHAATGAAPTGVFYIGTSGVAAAAAAAGAYCLGIVVHPAAVRVALKRHGVLKKLR